MLKLKSKNTGSFICPRIRFTSPKRKTVSKFFKRLKISGYIFGASIVCFAGVAKVYYDAGREMQAYADNGPISPVPKPTPAPKVVYQTKEVPVAVDVPNTEKAQILAYIVAKFGDHAADAITMIRKCENSQFNPKAVNWNKNGTWDTGIMMINQVHGYSLEDMQDWKKNIDVAYEIFKADDNSFYSWSCAGVINQKSYKDSL